MRALTITNSITNRAEKSIEKYLNDISKFEVLTPEEEVQLFNQYQDGDERALEKILSHNLRFVVSVAKQYQYMGLSLNDLINEGNLGLIKAAKRFDTSRGFKFISYAVWWIRQRIIQAINEKARKIRVPANIQTSMQKIRRCQERLSQVLNRPATFDELAEELDMEPEFVKTALDNYKDTRSIDAPSKEDTDFDMKNFLQDYTVPRPDENLVKTESLKIQIAELLKMLSFREREIITRYYGIGYEHTMNLEDIGHRLDITRERVRQIQARAIRRIRLYIRNNEMDFSFN